MKFNRQLLEEETLQKIKEVNDESGYRKYLEVPEMVNIIASIMEKKMKVFHDSDAELIQQLRDHVDKLEEENEYLSDFKAAAEEELEELKKTIQDLTTELEEYRSIAENIGAEKAISEKEKLEKIIKDTLRALPVGSISRHTPESIPERVQDWVKEAAEECRLREKWEELADNLIPYAEDFARYLEEGIYKNNPFSNHRNYQAVSNVIEQYEKLKNEP